MKNTHVLLITSAQNDLLSPKGKAWEMIRPTVEQNQVPTKLARLAEGARAAGMAVIHSPIAFDYTVMSGFEPLTTIQNVIIQNRLLAQGSPGAAFVAEAMPLPADRVLAYRQGFSAFWARTLQPELERLGARTIFIAGMLAEACISSHARDAAENGYRPVVVTDAIGATSLEQLQASLKMLSLHCHSLITTEEALGRFQAAAPYPGR
jgi:nicotinamidase-related amidase